MDSRVRSPAIPRKQINSEEAATNLAKKSKRSKSSETTLEDNDVFLRTKREKCQNEDPLAMLNKRWSIIAKTQDSMSKQEILQSYRLLMNDHLRLERFLSILTKDNEMARNRLETDLLDAMMCIEDLKQALEIRMARRRKIDPREAEERRSLIRQNKKLLNQLYESAKKIENLELTKLEMKEQLELLDFQMMEVENQKAIIEDELRRQPIRRNNEAQTDEDPESGPSLLSKFRADATLAQAELSNQKAEYTALLAKYHHLESLVRDLRRDNREIREQLARSEDAENSLAESDKHIQLPNLRSEIIAKDEIITQLQEELKKLSNGTDSSTVPLCAPSINLVAQGAFNDGIQPEVFESPMSIDSMQQKLDGTHIDLPSINEDIGLNENRDKFFKELVGELKSVRCSILKETQQKNISFSITSDEELLLAIRNLRLEIDKNTHDSLDRKFSNSLTPYGRKEETNVDQPVDINTPEYFQQQFDHLRYATDLSALQAQLTISEKRRVDLERRISEMVLEVTKAQTESRCTDTALTASRRTEAALRRRLLATMDTGSTRDRNRPASTFDFGYTVDGDRSTTKEEFETQANMIKIEAMNTALNETNHLDRVRLQQQASRIAHLEAEHRALHDRMSNLQASESCAQRAGVRLQALYEDMLREYSETSTQDATLRRRRRHVTSKNRSSNFDSSINYACNDKSITDNFEQKVQEASDLCQKIGNLQEELEASTNNAEYNTSSLLTLPQ